MVTLGEILPMFLLIVAGPAVDVLESLGTVGAGADTIGGEVAWAWA